MKVCILAVTKAFDKFCIAGMDEEGKWIRPVSNSPSTRFWKEEELIFNQGIGFIKVGDVIEFAGKRPFQYQFQNHTEDVIVEPPGFQLVQRMTNEELLNFINGKEEDEQAFEKTVNAQGRSLCLIKVDSFHHSISQYPGSPDKPKMEFANQAFNVTNPKTTAGDYIVKDCKWNSIILNNLFINIQPHKHIYLAIGLATPTPFNGVEYPQVIGLHTNPKVAYSNSYPH